MAKISELLVSNPADPLDGSEGFHAVQDAASVGATVEQVGDYVAARSDYYTAAKVLATVLAGLSTVTGTVVTSAHTILEAIGFLQAQVSAKASLASPALTGNPTAPTQSAGDNSTRIATTAYTDAAVSAVIGAADAMIFKGVIDCSANPNYPAADAGNTYKVSVAGKIGGASGIAVEVGDLLLCITDGTSAGTQASVGSHWSIAQTNIDGAVIGPASVTDGNPAVFDGTTGKLLKQVTFSAFKTALSLAVGDVSGAAPLASPALTGNPTAPTQTAGDNSTKLATTAYVDTADALKAPLASPALTGTPTAPTQTAGNNSTRLATTAYVDTADALKAPLASPALTGNPTAPTQTAGDNSTKLATTAYVDALSYAVDNVQSGSTYTLALSDAQKELSLTNASACAVSIPLNATVAFPVGTRIPIWADAAGTFTIVGVSGVTLNGISAGTPTGTLTVNVSGVRNGVVLRKLATNTWTVSGAIGAVA